jgi:hypothetical protein
MFLLSGFGQSRIIPDHPCYDSNVFAFTVIPVYDGRGIDIFGPKRPNSGFKRAIALPNEVAGFRFQYNIGLNTPALIE